jgi:arylsulfatase A-like enzyme
VVRGLSNVLRVFALGLPVAGLTASAEAIAASRGSSNPWTTAGLLLLYFGVSFLPVALLAGSVMLLWQRLPQRLRARLPHLFLVAGAWLIIVSWLHQFVERFANRELAGLLLAVLTLGLATGLALVLVGLSHTQVWAQNVGRPLLVQRASWMVALIGSGICLKVIVSNNQEGFAQLNPWLMLTPSIALLGAVAVTYFDRERLRLRAPHALASVAVLCSLTWLVGSLRADLPQQLLDTGSWGALGVRGVRAASDVDRDGYSSLVGGGDCAPFDPRINPAAVDIPGDGIDNNCIAGDAVPVPRPRPIWVELPEAQTWNVVYVSIEALRPDHLSLLGYERDTTPELKKLGQDAFVFERAYAPSTLTRWSLPSILSSLPPSRVSFDTKEKQLRLGKDTPWLPSLLQKAGYRTAAFHTKFALLTKNTGIGLHRGFQHYDADTPLQFRGGSMKGFPGDEQVQRAIAQLEKWAGEPQPFFLWLHLVEPHYHYSQKPGAPDFGKRDIDRYDSEIWNADQNVGQLVQALKDQGLHDKTLLVVTGDHGEEFGEHGKSFHGKNLFDPQTRTLLLMRIPGQVGRHIQAPVCLNEMTPTLLNALGLKSQFEQMYSRNLMPLLRGAEEIPGTFVLELFEGWKHSNYQAAAIRWPHKAMWSEGGDVTRVFDLVADPAEKRALRGAKLPAAAKALTDDLQAFVESQAKRSITQDDSTEPSRAHPK